MQIHFNKTPLYFHNKFCNQNFHLNIIRSEIDSNSKLARDKRLSSLSIYSLPSIAHSSLYTLKICPFNFSALFLPSTPTSNNIYHTTAKPPAPNLVLNHNLQFCSCYKDVVLSTSIFFNFSMYENKS